MLKTPDIDHSESKLHLNEPATTRYEIESWIIKIDSEIEKGNTKEASLFIEIAEILINKSKMANRNNVDILEAKLLVLKAIL